VKICPACQTTYGDEVRSCPQDSAVLIGGILEPGTLLHKKYRILSLIGFGGMAVVYRARHLLWNEDRAVKILRQPCGESFLAEAKIMRLLQHPNIVQVDDAGFTEDDQPFVAMEYVEGEDLRRRMRRAGLFSPEASLRITADTCAALGAAHASGVVHRDIKPQNLLLARAADGESIKVIDFGIAKVREDAGLGFTGVVPSMTGDFVGTLEYASPEQAMGIRSSDLDGRTDLYSLGLVMYEMLTGVLPFRAATPMGVLVQRLQVLPAPPESLRPDLPRGVCEIVMRSLQRERADRFSSATEMQSACEREIAAIEQARADALRRKEEARAAQLAAEKKRGELERRRRQRRARFRDLGGRIPAAIRHPRLAPRNVMTVAAAFVLTGIAALGVFTYSYAKYAKLVDDTLRAGSSSGSVIYSAPRRIASGDPVKQEGLVELLRLAGYSESRSNPLGYFQVRPASVEIYPGPESYFDAEPGVIRFQDGHVTQIVSLNDNTSRPLYLLEPVPIGSFGENSVTRVRYVDLPRVMVEAVIAAEDRRFFVHAGIDPFGKRTISAQLAELMFHASGSWETNEIAIQLERKLTKEHIFERYMNGAAFGKRGGQSITGVDEAARDWLGKPVASVSAPEAAFLAGLIHCPECGEAMDDALKARRDKVLTAMREAGFLTDKDYEMAIASPLRLARTPALAESISIAMVKSALEEKFQDQNFEKTASRIVSTLDPDLQALGEAAAGKSGATLMALDPHTGEILAAIGELRAHRFSSAFQPFVYAAGLSSALAGGSNVLTPSTLVVDEPTTFYVGNKAYVPADAKGEFYGATTVRQALARSLIVPTAKVAEMSGYENVADLAKVAGLNPTIAATPDLALGAFDVTPMEALAAYTTLANRGSYVRPHLLSTVRGGDGNMLYRATIEQKQVLDPRVAYLAASMMEDGLRTGVATAVRTRGFSYPAAAMKEPGESGWFAGFTTAILCVVWAPGKGDAGSLPIWTEFMKRAAELPRYRAAEFSAPIGIVSVSIDAQSGEPATPQCPKVRQEVYIAGTEPVGACHLHGGRGSPTTVSGWETAPPPKWKPPAPPTKQTSDPKVTTPLRKPSPLQGTVGTPDAQKVERKKGLLRRLNGVFK
jgi:penicillin-binding protein 1B